jgi:hypothetical protein
VEAARIHSLSSLRGKAWWAATLVTRLTKCILRRGLRAKVKAQGLDLWCLRGQRGMNGTSILQCPTIVLRSVDEEVGMAFL